MRSGELGHENVTAPPLCDFLWVRRLQIYCLPQIGKRILDRAALACDVELGAEADVHVAFLVDDCREESPGLRIHNDVRIA